MITPDRCRIMCGITLPGDQPRALEVDVEHRVPGLLGQLVGQPVGADPGVVEQDVDPAEAGRPSRPPRPTRRVVAHVAREGQARDARSAQSAARRVQVVRRAHAVAGVGQPLATSNAPTAALPPGQGQRRRAPLAVGRAGDERHLARLLIDLMRALARPREGLQVVVEVHPQRVVEHVGRDHQRAEGRERHDLRRRSRKRRAGPYSSSGTPLASTASWRRRPPPPAPARPAPARPGPRRRRSAPGGRTSSRSGSRSRPRSRGRTGS